ncbi:ABC transporter ATP-binding protein [Echinicola strongylocentroti]|uniref:ABC transporter ATP-binding protein n=1 Tax=Echinicola strongylocentroti TaxID=1795355 RepID=A0A2Z4IQI5_9BACT|nr:ABC transporter ATP-binding protein [Echinicola strongylocentroti]AWW33074.1 ABC transporter ATP-binding protein [Echinicola strongylocentroti]
MEKPIINLDGLTKYYGSFKAVDSLDLRIKKGEIFGLLGPNGAGKTTTILMMLGLAEPSSGTAHVCGINATIDPIAVKRRVGYMPDSIGFYDNMTALENLKYIGELNGIIRSEIEERAVSVLETVGLSGAVIHKKASAFSRGMKQRLGLAEVLIKDPEVVVLDEPTLGIDPSGVREFLALISRLSRERGLTVLLSSHHLYQVQKVCDRVGIFVGGTLLGEGSIDYLAKRLFSENPHSVKVTLQEALPVSSQEKEELMGMTAVLQVTVDGHSVEIGSKDNITPEIVRFFVEKGYGITAVQNKEYGLEEIYQTYFENNKIENKIP